MGVTTDRNSPCLDEIGEDGMQACYLVLSEEERAKGFVRLLRRSYVHTRGCGALTAMGLALCETYARNPSFYGATYCVGERTHFPVGEFDWDEDGEVVGS
jgi:hypothetical protein